MGMGYYKRYPRDFIEGTIGLSFELKASYSFILDLIYVQQGRLQDDARYIAGLLGVSVRKWTALRQGLIEAGKLHADEGHLINYRAIIELEKYAKLGDKMRENASTPRKNKDLQKPKHRKPEPEPEPYSPSLRSGETRVPATNGFDAFWSKYPNKVGKRDAQKSFTTAITRAPIETILDGLDAYCRKTDDRPWCNPSTWLNQDRWADQPSTVPRQTNYPNSDGMLAALKRRMEKHDDETSYDAGDSQDPDFPLLGFAAKGDNRH